MGLFNEPVIKKFFTHKIESSRASWGDYLLEVADVFSTLDGEDLDRETIKDRFLDMSGRSLDTIRDASNYRDEFGAYGTYLGVFRFEKKNGSWKVFLSNSARRFLCSTEPDVEGFCRLQMSLFQYPNGAGAAIQRGKTVRMQNNVKTDTVREISHNIRINPLRLICKVVVVLHEIDGIALSDLRVPYKTLLMLMNDDRINGSFSPEEAAIHEALEEYKTDANPSWVNNGDLISKFKRNFHIFDWTGLFKRKKGRTKAEGALHIATGDQQKIYEYIKEISSMTHDFLGFEECYNQTNFEQKMLDVVYSPKWGSYFDALKIPGDTLDVLSDHIIIDGFDDSPLGTIRIETQPFPGLNDFQANQVRAFVQGANHIDPIETLVRREKANREHARILALLASRLRAQDHPAYENTFIDLCSEADSLDYIFEVKSNTMQNALSQIRKAIAQLYEYRYRSQKTGAVLCIVMQQKPRQDWIVDYLVNDRDICICWMVDLVRIECPPQCHRILSQIGVV